MNRPILIIFAGLIGTGKSILASLLSKRLNIPIISSDIIRKELSNTPSTEHRYEEFEKGIYSREWTDKTYTDMIKRAYNILMKGSSVIIEASFKKKHHRKLILDLAAEMGMKFYLIETVCKTEEIKKRLASRIKNEKSASDGRLEIYDRQKSDFDVIDEINRDSHIIVDTTKPVDVCIEKILERLIHD